MGRKEERERTGMECAIVFTALCTVEDCMEKRISRWLLALGLAAGMAAAGWRIFQGKESWYSVGMAVLPGAVLLGACVVTEGKIGRGDGDMAFALGLFLGWELCCCTLCIAFLLAAVYAGAGLVLGRLRRSSRLAFAPFLLAALLAVWIASGGEL